jgi:uncharacterized membrane protein
MTMTTTTTTTDTARVAGRPRRVSIATAAALLSAVGAAAAHAAAQPEAPKPPKMPAIAEALLNAADAPGVSSKSVTTLRADGRTVRVVSEDGVTTIELDGDVVQRFDPGDSWTTFDVVDPETDELIAVVLKRGSGFHVAPMGNVAQLDEETARAFEQRQRAAAPPRSFIGIVMAEASEGAGDGESVRGVRILEVADGSPAAEAGLVEGDVIIEIAARTPVTTRTITELVRERTPGDTVQVVVRRDGDRLERSITLAERAASTIGGSGRLAPGEDEQDRLFEPFGWSGVDGRMEELSRHLAKTSREMEELAARLVAASARERTELARVMSEQAQQMADRAAEAAKLLGEQRVPGWQGFGAPQVRLFPNGEGSIELRLDDGERIVVPQPPRTPRGLGKPSDVEELLRTLEELRAGGGGEAAERFERRMAELRTLIERTMAERERGERDRLEAERAELRSMREKLEDRERQLDERIRRFDERLDRLERLLNDRGGA